MPVEIVETIGSDVKQDAHARREVGAPQQPAVSWREEAIKSGCDEVRRLLRSGCHSQSGVSKAEDALTLLTPTLRSKPDNPLKLAEALLAGARDPGSFGVAVVLASPTADKEVAYFLDCARRLRQTLGRVQVDCVLVRWENLVDDSQVCESIRSARFYRLADYVRGQMAGKGWEANRLHVVDISAGDDGVATISSPPAFALADEEVSRAASQPGNNRISKELAQDLKWAVDYYGRQASLGRLGRRQALFDLAVRRELGRAISTGRLWSGERLAPTRICLTSELMPRMVRCYRLGVANLNISVSP